MNEIGKNLRENIYRLIDYVSKGGVEKICGFPAPYLDSLGELINMWDESYETPTILLSSGAIRQEDIPDLDRFGNALEQCAEFIETDNIDKLLDTEEWKNLVTTATKVIQSLNRRKHWHEQ